MRLDIRRGDHRVLGLRPFLVQARGQGLSASSILDVGAYRGEWSRIAASVFPRARFVLVEPLDEMAPFLQGFCRDYPGSHWEQAVALDHAGSVDFGVWTDLGGSSLASPASDTGNGAGRRQVPGIRLDHLYTSKGLPLPQIVKVDVQGAELRALDGATALFGHVELFILEVSLYRFLPDAPLIDEIVGYMAERDFVVFDIIGFLRRPLDGALGQMDVCFARKEGVLRRSDRWD